VRKEAASFQLHPPLAFVGVGVPKAGTTSLHEALKRHPRLVLPRGKEAPFFLQPEAQLTQEAWTSFVRTVFPHTRGLLGKITPQYWYDPRMPEKLLRAFGPGLRILVVLRDPVEAVISAYHMHVRRGEEQRPFAAFLAEAEAHLEEARHRYDPEGSAPARILAGVEYARILSRYQHVFPPEALYVTFFEELVKAPDRILHEIQTFLGVEPRPLPFPRTHIGQVSPPARWLANRAVAAYQRIRSFPWVLRLLRTLTGPLRHDLAYWAFTHQAVRDVDPSLLPSPECMEALRERFRTQVEDLAALLGRRPPWPGYGRASTRRGSS